MSQASRLQWLGWVLHPPQMPHVQTLQMDDKWDLTQLLTIQTNFLGHLNVCPLKKKL